MNNVLSEERLNLARELVDDVELSRLEAEQILLKALRLARLIENENAQEWLQFELRGYPNTPQALPWMRYFCRFTNETSNIGYWIPLAGISALIATMQIQIRTLRVPDINFAPSSSNPNEYVGSIHSARTMIEPSQAVLSRLQNITSAISDLSSIRSRVLAAVHDFAVSSFHKFAFSSLAESIFEKHRKAVDEMMRLLAPDVFEKLPTLYDRLAAEDAEAISQAMNSLRRIIKSLADNVYPARDETVIVNGQSYEIGNDKVLNRVKLFLLARCSSESRRDRLNRSLRDIHERASAGVHTDISNKEARSLFLGTYLTVGEILEFVENSGNNA